MKKIFIKRSFAFLIDVFLFAFLYEMLRNYLSSFLSITGSWGYFIIVLPLVMRDLLLRNASLGKALMGLVVVDEKWSAPSVATVIKRTVLTTALGHLLLYRLRKINENMEEALLAEQEWELQYLKARVVERKVYKALKEKATSGGTIDVAAMNQLYDQYLYGT